MELLGKHIDIQPTIGFNVETIVHRNITFTVWDVGGQTTPRTLWHHYYQSSQAVIMVIDSTDHERIDELRNEIKSMMLEPQLRGVELLFFYNKQDAPNAMTPSQITERLQLCSIITDHQWHVQPTVATTGQGVYEGLEWLSSSLSNKAVSVVDDLLVAKSWEMPAGKSCFNVETLEYKNISFTVWDV
eukprot:gene7344-8553_t